VSGQGQVRQGEVRGGPGGRQGKVRVGQAGVGDRRRRKKEKKGIFMGPMFRCHFMGFFIQPTNTFMDTCTRVFTVSFVRSLLEMFLEQV
jgi:hypothetical protein